MGSSANVQSIQALEDLKGALNRFGNDAGASLQAAAMEISRTQEWLAERKNHWRREVERMHEAADRAKADLKRCMDSGYTDSEGHYHPPSCGPQEAAAKEAERHLKQTEDINVQVLQTSREVDQAVTEYQRQAHSFGTHLSNDVSMATAMLSRMSSTLQAYAATSSTSDAAWTDILSVIAPAFLSSSMLQGSSTPTDGRGGKEISGSGFEGGPSTVEGGGIER